MLLIQILSLIPIYNAAEFNLSNITSNNVFNLKYFTDFQTHTIIRYTIKDLFLITNFDKKIKIVEKLYMPLVDNK